MFLVEPFQNCITDVIAKFRNYLKIRNNKFDDQLLRKIWTQGKLTHPKQTDSSSCGIFVLKIAEALLSNKKKIRKRIHFDNKKINKFKIQYCCKNFTKLRLDVTYVSDGITGSALMFRKNLSNMSK
uniref:uncharacterized protein LOC104266586 n=1 Tax=Ciona intestinalis TaxID=7719 RepID=UPI000EF4B472|nr:uncharacterized protein LOC104266586 [Ciona intestinalis]|eukprot:XP_026694421.1 uncharacterized protein LOC104266586 [Ciona intestinalis]